MSPLQPIYLDTALQSSIAIILYTGIQAFSTGGTLFRALTENQRACCSWDSTGHLYYTEIYDILFRLLGERYVLIPSNHVSSISWT